MWEKVWVLMMWEYLAWPRQVLNFQATESKYISRCYIYMYKLHITVSVIWVECIMISHLFLYIRVLLSYTRSWKRESFFPITIFFYFFVIHKEAGSCIWRNFFTFSKFFLLVLISPSFYANRNFPYKSCRIVWGLLLKSLYHWPLAEYARDIAAVWYFALRNRISSQVAPFALS